MLTTDLRLLVLVFLFLCSMLLGIRLGHVVGLPTPGWKGAAQVSSLLCMGMAVFMMSAHQPHPGLLSVEDVACFGLVFVAAFAGGAARAGFIKPTKS